LAHDATAHDPDHHERERLLRMLAAATFVIFFQAYMVVVVIPLMRSLGMGPPWWHTGAQRAASTAPDPARHPQRTLRPRRDRQR
jgi:hypothetical protein